jgi:hypothetical protein
MGEEKSSLSKETNEKKQQWNLLKYVGRAHPSFLKAFKETESLSQLAALSIVIAAFSSDQPAARQFAIVAGAMFLLAFVFSTSVVLGAREMYLELYSYILTGLGITFLGAVVVEYVVVSNLLGSALGLAGNILIGVLQLSLLPSVIGDLRTGLKQKRVARNWKTLVGVSLFSMALLIYNGFNFLVYTPYQQLILGVPGGGALAFSYYLVAITLSIPLTKLTRALYRRQKKVKIVVEK